MTPEEIKLTVEQEARMIEMVSDITSADTGLKIFTRLQYHMKIIWNHAQQEERESCAKIAIQAAFTIGTIKGTDAEIIAQAIRARGYGK